MTRHQGTRTKELTGKIAYLSGDAAERQVANDYTRRGHERIAHRWRGKAGEIDLVFRAGNEIIFVEVKKARSFEHAAARISPRQQARICAAAEEFLGSEPNGLLTPMRVDAALVDSHGTIQIVENAISA